ncbi:MAG: tetratricopeptide repeat protein [Planctomycetales bacterium]|nr:tetratricopeptide repeat protein [Planctomycetales bacterium]
METVLLLAFVPLGIAALLLLVVQPLWSLVDCLIDSEKSVISKIGWGLGIFFAGVLASFAYALVGTSSRKLRMSSIGMFGFMLLSGAAAVGVLFATPDGKDLIATLEQASSDSLDAGLLGDPASEAEASTEEDDTSTATFPVAIENHPAADSIESSLTDAVQELTGTNNSIEALKYKTDAASNMINGEHDKALDAISKAIEITPDDLDSYIVRARINEVLGRKKSFNKDLLHVARTTSKEIKDNEAVPQTYYNRGQALSMLGKFNQAIVDLEHAVQLEPENPLFEIGLTEAKWKRDAKAH